MALGPAEAADRHDLKGDLAYEESIFRDLAAGTVIDARGATWRLANSATTQPNAGSSCEEGPLPVNRYPLRIYDSPGATVLGPRFEGEVSLSADWQHAYCNSAALGVWDSPGAAVKALRARRVWDAVRIAGASPGFEIEDAWLSDVRDDCVENDYLLEGRIAGSLLDGCFVGVSARYSGEGAPDASDRRVTLSGVLMRMQPFAYKGRRVQGAPLKTKDGSPQFDIYDSVIALGAAPILSGKAWRRTWEHVGDCDNNLLLVPSDRAWPEDGLAPPDCFRIVRGEAARFLWDEIRQNWIRCAERSVRFPEDPAADAARCDGTGYGVRYR